MMNKFYLLLVCLFSIISAYGQETLQETLMHNGELREYTLYVPASYDGNSEVPLLFNFHGYTSNAGQQMFYGNFLGLSDTHGFIVVHPQGLLDANGITHFNAEWQSDVDDIGYASALIDHLASEYSIDLSRVYSTGMSNGGFMSYTLACRLSDRFAAIASVTGTMVVPQLGNCTAERPMPVMQIHGTEDETVPYEGFDWMAPIDDVIAYWVEHNNCDTIPVITDMPDTNTNDGSTVTRYVYSNGDDNSSVELLQVTGGAHTWPGTGFNFPGTNQDINASALIWEFFSKYDLNGAISNTEELNQSSIEIFPNPTTDQLTIDGLNINDQIQIHTLTGQRLTNHRSTNSSMTIDLNHLPKGGYLLCVTGENQNWTEVIFKID